MLLSHSLYWIGELCTFLYHLSYSISLGLKAFAFLFLFLTFKYFFQVMLSIFIGPYSLYLILDYWVYPLKDYIGDTGCYFFIYGRNIGNFTMQLHSFFVATFRYVCLFHDKFLLKFNISPSVSNNLEERTFFYAKWRYFPTI